MTPTLPRPPAVRHEVFALRYEVYLSHDATGSGLAVALLVHLM